MVKVRKYNRYWVKKLKKSQLRVVFSLGRGVVDEDWPPWNMVLNISAIVKILALCSSGTWLVSDISSVLSDPTSCESLSSLLTSS